MQCVERNVFCINNTNRRLSSSIFRLKIANSLTEINSLPPASARPAFHHKQVKLMWTPEALSLFMINHTYLDSLNDVEIYNASKKLLSFVIHDSIEQCYCKEIQNIFK